MKNILKGGLMSLIPHRDFEDADEALERLDDEATEPKSKEAEAKPKIEEPLASEEGDISTNKADDGEKPASKMPKKPLVTPLTMADIGGKKTGQVQVVKKIEPAKAGLAEPKWDKHEERVEHVAIEAISTNPTQPRRKFNEQDMAELAESIDQHGILQPLVVRRAGDGQYELIAGERRLRAAKSLGWNKVPCVVRRGVKTQASRLELALIENIQREDLNPIEEALAYKQLNEEYGMTHEEIGQRVGRSRVGITNSIRVLQLPEEVQKGIIDDLITTGHAKAILMIPDSDKQVRFYRHMVEEGLTVRKAERRARRIQRTMQLDEPMRTKRQNRGAFEIKYSGKLEERFGFDSKVRFLETHNRYEVVFKCYSKPEIDELLGRLMGERELPMGEDSDVVEEEEE